DDDLALEQPLDQHVRAGQFGRERVRRHSSRVELAVEQGEIRIAPVLPWMGSEPLRREKWPLHVGADDARRGPVRRHRAQRVQHRALGRGDERRLERGDAALEQRGARAFVVRGRGGQEVDAGVAVHLEVDKTGHRDTAAPPPGETHRDDGSVLDLDVPENELSADERSFDAEPHALPPSAIRTEPPAPSSRSRAIDGSIPARSDTSATRASPPAAASASSTSCSSAPLASWTFLRARSRSLAFSGATPTINPANVRPRRIIVTVEIALRTSFCAVPAFRRVEPDTTSGPTMTATSCCALAPSALCGAHTTATQSAPAVRADSSAASV